MTKLIQNKFLEKGKTWSEFLNILFVRSKAQYDYLERVCVKKMLEICFGSLHLCRSHYLHDKYCDKYFSEIIEMAAIIV